MPRSKPAKPTAKSTAKPIVIAIDGPAASGKGTLGRSLALHYGLDYLDTGKIYRAVAWRLIQNGSCPTCLDDALQACQHIIAAGAADMMHQLAQPSLLLDDVATIASQIAAITPVREALQKIQRDFATEPPGGLGAVLDGRDIGTVICPDADVKLFIDAALEKRAERRFRELQKAGKKSIYTNVLADMRLRDGHDRNRATAPLQAASDAWQLDSTDLDPKQLFDAASTIIDHHVDWNAKDS